MEIPIIGFVHFQAISSCKLHKIVLFVEHEGYLSLCNILSHNILLTGPKEHFTYCNNIQLLTM